MIHVSQLIKKNPKFSFGITGNVFKPFELDVKHCAVFVISFFLCHRPADDDYDLPVDDTELSQKCYLRACKELDIPSIRTIYLGLVKETLSCKGLVLQPYDIKACTIALVVCETFIFYHNFPFISFLFLFFILHVYSGTFMISPSRVCSILCICRHVKLSFVQVPVVLFI